MSQIELHLDFETFSRCDLKTRGLDNYLADPSTEILMLAFAVNEALPEVWFPTDGPFPDHLRLMIERPEILKVSFNAEFERTILQQILGITTPIRSWADPMIMARHASIAGDLAFVGEVLGISEDKKKSADGRRLIKLFCEPAKRKKKDPPGMPEFNDATTHPEDWAKFVEYCRQDVIAERELYNKLKAFRLPPDEQKMYELDQLINERGLQKTSLGTLSLTAGAFDDAVSWCVLAVVLATFGGGPGVAILAIGGGLLWMLLVLTLGPKILAPLGRMVEREGEMSTHVLALVILAFCVSAFLMDAVGIHAIFGGFIMGVVMPRGRLTEELKKKVEPLAVVLLLPMFFTYSGLNTRMDMVNSGELLLIALGILAVSILAKWGACYVAARLTGEDHPTAMGIGALMNSRGLMELIIINIGLQKGIIGPTLFSMLVLMAIVTTVMASPLFEIVYGKKARERGELDAVPDSARV